MKRALIATAIPLALGLLVTGCGSGETASASAKSTASVSRAPSPKSPMATLRADLSRTLGSSNRDGVKRIKKVGREDGGQITIKWAIDNNISDGTIRTGARSDVRDILSTVKGVKGLKYDFIYIEGSFSMQDQYGKTSETPVLRLGYQRSTIRKMHLDNLPGEQVVALADGPSYVQPAFQGD